MKMWTSSNDIRRLADGLEKLHEQQAQRTSQIDILSRDVSEVREDGKAALEQLTKLNGKVSKHEAWISLRTDREDQKAQAKEKRGNWQKVYISVAGTLSVSIIALLIDLVTRHPS
jgi:chromosome segregation ATPase